MHVQYLKWDPRRRQNNGSIFDRLKDIFDQLLLISGGDVAQALRWLTDLDKEYGLTDDAEGYSVSDFIDELKERGYLNDDNKTGQIILTAKAERGLRQRSLEEIFRGVKQNGLGNHRTNFSGKGLEREPESRNWQFGDDIHNMDATGTILNSLKHSTLDQFSLQEDDLRIYEQNHYSTVATALCIDLSHSMVLYGEDRITPARKVALALAELIMNQFEKDSLDIIAFGNEAWQVQLKDLPYLQVGPYHTNTKAALELARSTLQHRKHANKQIFMITDGKPSCMIHNGKMYKNSFGLDRRIVNKVLDEAVKCRREQISITTFMIARDPYLQNFVRKLTEANRGRAYYASLDKLGGYVFQDYMRNRTKRLD
ncbi:MAG TPA: VWA domain-containing protein [Balneolales bacterium]|nr:VWA domain-containing protein [Balneolales bacterium]